MKQALGWLTTSVLIATTLMPYGVCAKATAEPAQPKTCTERNQPKQDRIPFPISRMTVAQAALEKAQANYNAVCETSRKDELILNLDKYDKSVADVEYMLAEEKSKFADRQDAAKKADSVFYAAQSKAMMAGVLVLFATWNTETTRSEKNKSEIKKAEAALKSTEAYLAKCVSEMDGAKQLSNQAHADLAAAMAVVKPARDKLVNAELRYDIAGDQANWSRNDKKTAAAALAKAQAAYDAAKQQAK